MSQDTNQETSGHPYIVSARKYRPDSFSALLGQDNIVQTLKNSIVRGQLAHAYLFCGPRGVGKTSAARIFAKTINCANPTADMEPCGECESCVSFREGRSYCIHELDAASNNSVDDIKTLIDQVNIPPQVGRYSVYIVDEVHMLSQAAFNAFLKTLEEPPAHAIFILATTEKHKILPTILSRCQTYDFNRIGAADMVKNLRSIASREGVTIDDESLHVIAMKADGAMRDALTIFDQTVAFCGTQVRYEDVLKNLNVLDYEHCFRLVEDFLSGDYQKALLKFDEVLSKGFNALHFVAALSSHLRDLLVARSGALDALLELPESLKKKYRDQASRCTLPFLYEALSITTQCEAGYRASVNPRLHIELALMRLSFLSGGVPAAKPAQAVPAAKEPAPAAPVPAEAPRPKPAPAASENSEKPAAVPEVPASAASEKPAAAPEVPAPTSPAEPAAPARTRRRAPRAASALSIASIDAPSSEASAAREDSPSDKLPSDEEILAAWNALPAEYASRPRLSGSLSSAKVEINESDGVKVLTFFVVNLSQQQWIQERLLMELEGRMQSRLSSSRLKLLVEVTPVEEVEKTSLTQREKAQALIEKNAEIMNLVKDLGLDT